ncbi:MATE family efflux transporter [Candidatus Babeliales bacterium]|nr:MATE family efflux transporter [Candidatus Babeliales bacterium]
MLSELKTKNILKLTWPTIISQATVTAVGLVDLFFIGQISISAIAAASIANSFITTLYYSLEGIKTGTAVLTANYSGAQEKNNISKTLKLSLIFAITIGLTLAIFSPLIAKFISTIFSSSDIKQDSIKQFLSIILTGAPFTLIVLAISGFFIGLENTFIPFVITSIIFLTNVSIDYTLINGKFGLPKMGIYGVAIGSLIAYVIGAILSIIILIKHKLTKDFVKIKVKIRKLIKEYSRLFLEIGIYTGLLTLAILIFIFIIKRLGSQAIAAYEITHQVFLVSFLPPYGFQIAASVIIGKLFGENYKNLVLPTTKKIMFLCFIIVFIITLFTYIFAHNIAVLFDPTDPYVASLTTITIRLVCIEQLFSPIAYVCKGSLMGLKDTGFIAIAGFITAYLFFLPLAYVLSIWMNYGIIGGWVAFIIWAILDSIIFFYRLFISKKWLKYHI